MKITPQQLEKLYNTMQIKQQIMALNGQILRNNIPQIVAAKVATMVANKSRYRAVSHKFPTPIRWYHVALLHEMEAEQDFTKYLGNGQSLNRVTTIKPKGRGPFNSFEEGAVDAIIHTGLDKVTDWSVGNTLYKLEGFNGYGYEIYHNILSPYIWSGSNHYVAGKYTSDGHFDPNAVSQQIGIALLYKHLEDIGELTS